MLKVELFPDEDEDSRILTAASVAARAIGE
jgi:hypothetical protein